MKKQKCIMCHDPLEMFDEKYCQPYGGGEIQLIFAYGSFKFDKHIGNTVFKGVICDNCAECLMVDRLVKEEVYISPPNCIED